MARGEQLTELEMLVLLAVMGLKDNAYGVTIRQELERRAKREASIGAVYIALDRLEGKGFVRSGLGEATQERGGRAKRFFTISPSGRQMVRNSLRTLNRMASGLTPAEDLA